MKRLLILLLCPATALAHAQLERTTPAVGSTVATSPAELRLQFSEALEARFSRVQVTNAAGASVTVGAPHVDPGAPDRLLVPVGRLPAGAYTVTWHAVSVDTHRTQGSYRFTIAP